MSRHLSSNQKKNERIRKLKLLLEFGKRIIGEHRLDILLKIIADEARAILKADRCSIFIYDPEKEILNAKIAHGIRSNIEIPAGKGIAGASFQTRRLINIKNAYQDTRFNPELDRQTGYKTRSILSCPMEDLHGQIIGVFEAINKSSSGYFDHEDEEILSILSSQAAVAIENAELYKQAREAAEKTIMRLAKAAEFKDHDTGSHIIRMSQYCSLIAEQMGFPKIFCERIQLASPMHDVGKIGVADSILKKSGKLNENEWKEMKKHPVYGGRILSNPNNGLLRMARNIALTHHEKYDGSGYPKGLKGNKIPIEGRITALADVFDALCSKRAYKKRFSVNDALQMVRKGRGKHFDPKVVDAFFSALPKILKVMKRYPK